MFNDKSATFSILLFKSGLSPYIFQKSILIFVLVKKSWG